MSKSFLPLVFLGFLLTFPVWAQSTAKNREAIQIKLDMVKVTKNAKGQISHISTKKIKPGDEVEYIARYTNVSKGVVRHLEATLPIPEGLVYQENSAQPKGALANTGAVAFSAIPLLKPNAGTDGKPEAVPLSEYRNLRWSIPELAAGKTIIVKARMKVSTEVLPGAELMQTAVPNN